MKIKDISEITKIILIDNPSARDDDMLLYFEVCKQISPIIEGMRFKDVMIHRELFGLPVFESVSRARRKLVETYPELKGSKRATDARFEKWKEVREYVSSEV